VATDAIFQISNLKYEISNMRYRTSGIAFGDAVLGPIPRQSAPRLRNFAFCILIFNVLMCRPVQAGAPYPPSPVIEKIVWAPADTIVRRASGSDNLPVTWADDDALYITWGDGWGFKPKVPKKLSMGFARVIGGPDDFQGINIRSPAEQLGGGRSGKKGWGLISVDGVLYLWIGHADRKGGQAQLAWSRDHARTWTFADWRFPQFGLMGFVNFGRDNANARDDYVYSYSHDGPLADTPADRFILMRAPKERITEKKAWEFFERLDENTQPVWTNDLTRRGAVFRHTDGCLRSAMTYNAPLRRYLWWQHVPAPKGSRDRGTPRNGTSAPASMATSPQSGSARTDANSTWYFPARTASVSEKQISFRFVVTP